MTREWEQGDVAMVTAEWRRGTTQAEAAVKRSGGWDSLISGAYIHDHDAKDARPLVVIDAEDREQVERLHSRVAGCVAFDSLQAALREFADPKPEEPQGLGAVVEDRFGHVFVRLADCWFNVGDNQGCTWDHIAPVHIHSEGVVVEPLADWERDLLRGTP